MPSQWTTIHVDRHDIWAYMSLPDSDGPHPGVVVIQGGQGLNDWLQSICRRLSAAGYATVAPNLYHRQDPTLRDESPLTKIGRLRDEIVIHDINATIAHLSRHPSVRGDKLGITGFCIGGRVAYLMAGVAPLLRVAGVFYPASTMDRWGDNPTPLERTQSITCPIIGFFGEDDSNPSPADARKIEAELTRHGKTHAFHSYAGAGHAFQQDGDERYRVEAARDSWEKLLAWCQEYL